MMDLLSGIYGILLDMNDKTASQVGLLGEIAKNTVSSQQAGTSSMNSPFTGGFPESLNDILSGI